jgi:hypothetical protein
MKKMPRILQLSAYANTSCVWLFFYAILLRDATVQFDVKRGTQRILPDLCFKGRTFFVVEFMIKNPCVRRNPKASGGS